MLLVAVNSTAPCCFSDVFSASIKIEEYEVPAIFESQFMTPETPGWKKRLSSSIPTRETLLANSWLQPIASRVLDPKLWCLQHEAVARGVAVGLFWAFVLPVAQILVAVAHCTWWRANIPVAVGMTMVTNPLTIGFWLWLAYQLGVLVIGVPPQATAPEGFAALAYLTEFGWPTVLGMGIFAVGGAVTGYLAVKLAWRLRVNLKRRRRSGISVM